MKRSRERDQESKREREIKRSRDQEINTDQEIKRSREIKRPHQTVPKIANYSKKNNRMIPDNFQMRPPEISVLALWHAETPPSIESHDVEDDGAIGVENVPTTRVVWVVDVESLSGRETALHIGSRHNRHTYTHAQTHLLKKYGFREDGRD